MDIHEVFTGVMKESLVLLNIGQNPYKIIALNGFSRTAGQLSMALDFFDVKNVL